MGHEISRGLQKLRDVLADPGKADSRLRVSTLQVPGFTMTQLQKFVVDTLGESVKVSLNAVRYRLAPPKTGTREGASDFRDVDARIVQSIRNSISAWHEDQHYAASGIKTQAEFALLLGPAEGGVLAADHKAASSYNGSPIANGKSRLQTCHRPGS